MKQGLSAIRYLPALLIGIPPAFFLVFNAIFSDVFSALERLMTFLLIVVTYGILGAIFGFVWPQHSWRWGLWLSIAAILIAVLYSFRETGQLALHFLYIATTVSSACLAALGGRCLSAMRR